MTAFDITIVGAGVVGLTTACALADNSDLKISIVDKRETLTSKITKDYDSRVYAINRASQHVFESLNVWSNIIADRAAAYQGMYVWDQQGLGEIYFNCREIAEPNLGYIIENRRIVNALLEKLMDCENVSFLTGVQLKEMYEEEQQIILNTVDGREFHSKLLIAADGANSWVRHHNDFPMMTWDYHHRALVATVVSEKPHQRIATQCFMPDGPLAFLPLDEPHTCSIVWSSQPERIVDLEQLSDIEFCEQLSSAFKFHFGKVVKTSQRLSFPLQMRHAKHYCQDRIVLIGDAAHTIHPLAGQGVNLGILDAISLVTVIKEALAQQRDYAAFSVLRRYERARKSHNVSMIFAMEGFKRLFGNQDPILRWGRNLGLNLTDKIFPAKQFFMRQAGGLGSFL